MGGYDYNFTQPLDDKYKCPVCLTALRDPVQTKCGHRLCTSCFKSIRGGLWYFKCPVDNTWSNHVFEDNAVKREVLSLQVECLHKSLTCSWSGELRDLDEHVKTCGFVKVPCTNNCKAEVLRQDLDKHLLECPLRLAECEHCHEPFVVSQLARHHLLACPKFPLNCPMCGEIQVLREGMNRHINIINGNCPMVVVPCSFRHIGCMHQDKRIDMAKHYVAANTQHLMLLSTRLVDLETKHRLELQMCSNHYEQQLTVAQAKCELVDKKNSELGGELVENNKAISQLRSAVKELKILVHSNEFFNYHHTKVANKSADQQRSSPVSSSNAIITTSPVAKSSSNNVVNQKGVYEWTIDMTSRRKSFYSPSYTLANSGYKIHFWLKPEICIENHDAAYSSLSVILERCDDEEELPVSFDCCFFLTSSSATSAPPPLFPKQLKSFVTTDPFHLSGHVSKPMILFKTTDLMNYVVSSKSDDDEDATTAKQLLNLAFTIRATKESI